MKYQRFIFDDYTFSANDKKLTLRYSLDDQLHFEESFVFDFDFVADYSPEALDRALQLLFLVAGVSYYKTYLPPEIVVTRGTIDKPLAEFLSRTYQKGLGEFFFVNQLDVNTKILFPINTKALSPVRAGGAGQLIGIGGGKDSLVTTEALRNQPDIATWSLGHKAQLQTLVSKVNLPHLWVERKWDRQLLEVNGKGAYNGHIPISAILACAGIVVAILSGKQDVVTSVEQSANEDTLEYQGVMINHQYSKTQAFERDFQAVLQQNFGDSLRYYSFLRPLSEVRICELFAKTGFDTYKTAFSSCNRAYTHDSPGLYWCGTCPKCAFVFLALTPFVPRSELEALWGGKNLLLDPKLEPTYRRLLGIEGDKPLECVGEIKENRSAMKLAQDIYPELKEKYSFELPDNYDYKVLGSHEMPAEVYALFEKFIQQFSS